MASDVGDAADPRRSGGQRGERGDGRRELGCVVQVDVDADELARAGDGQASPVEPDVSPHGVEDLAHEVAGLRRVLGPTGHPAVPPVTSAAATNGPALDRSGSIHTSTR